ncbi:MAG: SDR family NAD(P)-dependent oxidoreductase [Bacteroidia bacterium]
MRTLYIITGANKGLGKAFYDILISDKDHNIVISISRQVAEDQSLELDNANGNFYFCKVDLGTLKNPSSIKIVKKFKKVVDKVVFISNAGIIEPLGLVGQLDINSTYTSIHVNAIAPSLLLNYIINNFVGKKIDLINISSGASERTIEGWSIYCSSKAFTRMLFETIKKENQTNHNLRVFQFDPGVIDTDMQHIIRQEDSFPWQKDFVDLKDSGKLKKPTDVAKSILNEIHAS